MPADSDNFGPDRMPNPPPRLRPSPRIIASDAMEARSPRRPIWEREAVTILRYFDEMGQGNSTTLDQLSPSPALRQHINSRDMV